MHQRLIVCVARQTQCSPKGIFSYAVNPRLHCNRLSDSQNAPWEQALRRQLSGCTSPLGGMQAFRDPVVLLSSAPEARSRGKIELCQLPSFQTPERDRGCFYATNGADAAGAEIARLLSFVHHYQLAVERCLVVVTFYMPERAMERFRQAGIAIVNSSTPHVAGNLHTTHRKTTTRVGSALHFSALFPSKILVAK